MGDHLSCKSAKILSLEEAKKMREHSCDSPKWIYDSEYKNFIRKRKILKCRGKYEN